MKGAVALRPSAIPHQNLTQPHSTHPRQVPLPGLPDSFLDLSAFLADADCRAGMYQVPALSDETLQSADADRAQRLADKAAAAATAAAFAEAEAQIASEAKAEEAAEDKLLTAALAQALHLGEADEKDERTAEDALMSAALLSALGADAAADAAKAAGDAETEAVVASAAFVEAAVDQRQSGEISLSGLEEGGSDADELARQLSNISSATGSSGGGGARMGLRKRLAGKVRRALHRDRDGSGSDGEGEDGGSGAAPDDASEGGESWLARHRRLQGTAPAGKRVEAVKRELESKWDTGVHHAAESIERRLQSAAVKAVELLPAPVARKVRSANVFRRFFPGMSKRTLSFGQVGRGALVGRCVGAGSFCELKMGRAALGGASRSTAHTLPSSHQHTKTHQRINTPLPIQLRVPTQNHMSAPEFDWEAYADDPTADDPALEDEQAAAGPDDGAGPPAAAGGARTASAAVLKRKLQNHPNLAVSGNPAMGPLLLFDIQIKGIHLDRSPGLPVAAVLKCGPNWASVVEGAVPLSAGRPGEPETEEEWRAVAGGGGVVAGVRERFEGSFASAAASSSSGGGGAAPPALAATPSAGAASMASNASGASGRAAGGPVPPVQVRDAAARELGVRLPVVWPLGHRRHPPTHPPTNQPKSPPGHLPHLRPPHLVCSRRPPPRRHRRAPHLPDHGARAAGGARVHKDAQPVPVRAACGLAGCRHAVMGLTDSGSVRGLPSALLFPLISSPPNQSNPTNPTATGATRAASAASQGASSSPSPPASRPAGPARWAPSASSPLT